MVGSCQERIIMVGSCQEYIMMVGSCQERIRMVGSCQEPVRSLPGRSGRSGKSRSCQDRQEASRRLPGGLQDLSDNLYSLSVGHVHESRARGKFIFNFFIGPQGPQVNQPTTTIKTRHRSINRSTLSSMNS